MKLSTIRSILNSKNTRLVLLIAIVFALPLSVFVTQQSQRLSQEAQGSIKVGVNMQGIVSYGHEQMQYMSTGDADTALQELQNMNVKIVRVFVANNQVSDAETANRLDNFLTRAAQHNISVVINLMHFFDIYGMHPQGTDQYYTNSVNLGGMTVSVLNDAFWAGGYKDRYKPFVNTVVSKNKNHSNIYAWEPCNECRDQEGNRQTFLAFMQDMTAYIKSIDPSHAISSGEEGTRVTGYTPQEFYGALPNIDIVSIHVYDGDRGPAPDAQWARAHGKRILIGEIGFNTSNSDRTSLLRNELNYWESQGAEAALQWAYMGSTFPVWQDGDGATGMPTDKPDYSNLKCLIAQFNGVSCNATAPSNTPPPIPTQQPTSPANGGTGPAGTPNNLSATCVTSTQVTLSWAPANNAALYDVHLSNGTSQRVYGTSVSLTVPANKALGWWMEAASLDRTSASIGGPQFTCSGSTGSTPPPNGGAVGLPGQSSLRATCINSTQVSLSWGSGANATHYPVHLSDGQNGDAYGTSYTFTVTTGKTYSWWMEAANQTQSTSSNVAGPQFTCNKSGTGGPPAGSGKPAAPTNLKVSCNTGSKQATISWSAGTNAEGYDIHYVKSGNASSQVNKRIYGLSYVFSPSSNQQYDFWMESFNVDGSADGPTKSFSCNFSDPTVPGNTVPTPVPPASNEKGTIFIQIRDESGNPISPTSGNLFVSNQSGRDSDNQNLAKPDEQCFKKQTQVGLYACQKTAANWYGGISTAPPPAGYTIVDGGVRLEDGDTPLTLTAGGSVTINVVLRQTGDPNSPPPLTTNPDFVPNCLNIQGPTTVRLGQTVTYLAQYDGPLTGKLAGTMNAVKTTNSNPKETASWEWVVDGNWPPQPLVYQSGVLSLAWTPTTAGVYQVFCRAYNTNAGNAECRGAANTVDAPPHYVCKGPGASITVNVVAGGVDSPESRGDMCEFATTIGGNAMILGGGSVNPKAPVIITAIPKPGYNIKQYSFAFYNLDNQPDKPKPIFFAPNTPYMLNSRTNNIAIPMDQFDNPDLNFKGKKPENIQVKAFFTDANGVLSVDDPRCNITLHAQNIASTVAFTQAHSLTQTTTTEQDRGAVIAAVGVLIIAVVVSLNFFFS